MEVATLVLLLVNYFGDVQSASKKLNKINNLDNMVDKEELKRINQESERIVSLLLDKKYSYSEINVILSAALGLSNAISTGEFLALSWSNALRK